MALITLLRRSRALSSPAAGQMTEVVEVTYSTPAIPPRQVHLSLEWYRPATEEELAANPLYRMLPRDGVAELAERTAIEQDMKAAIAPPLQTFEMP